MLQMKGEITMIKKIVIGGLALVGAVYVIAACISWNTTGMQDYVRAHRRDID